jgi:hypothetical protein
VRYHVVGSEAHLRCRLTSPPSGPAARTAATTASTLPDLALVGEDEPVHWETMTPTMRRIAERVFESGLTGQYRLAGGTGLALQLGHRRSNDLDFFPERTSGTVDRAAVRRLLGALETPVSYSVDQSTEVTVMVAGVKVSFVGYPYPWGEEAKQIGGLRVASPADILAMKTYALGRRGTARDYVDIAAGLQAGLTTLDDLIAGAVRRFVLEGEPQFSERLFLQQLAYTRDISQADKDAISDEMDGGSFDDMLAELNRHLTAYLAALGNNR